MKTEEVSNTEMLAVDHDGGSSDALNALGGVQLADYQLLERLGAGGYGEVWKAIGPGGLPKAVKVLYGERDGQHAEVELKALERMRHLRHPFLLSIERIEVVNSRLIVVSELADGNLMDRFEDCRRDSKPGIPRDELLGYLRDAADALDFMAEQHGLQHLDIKPDNLLLQGGHAKVGDFGLAKDISTTNVSVLNGFTPLFAAPELFEGRPGRASDQYSLAIVYQMMLTGEAPFNGRTAAQLTAQHLRSQPDLTNLQPIDRPVVARALSKNMNSRFDNCRQFVDELIRRKHARPTNRAFVQNLEDTDVTRTALLKTKSRDSLHSMPQNDSAPVSITAVSTENAALRPSVIISVGGLAGSVLRSLKNRIVQRTQTPTSPIPLLHVDTDRDTITDLKLSGDDTGLSAEETLSIPLRSSNEYRSATGLDLSWLSRRWLFNIPRSGKVDSIRPLGRLALCDHQKAVEARLQTILQEAVNPDGRAAAGVVTELPLTAEEVDVYVIGATSGGTSSGIIADIGLMVKSVARKAGIRNLEVHGVLLHGTAASRNVTDIQEANTVSVMKELRHLSTPGMGTPRGFEKNGVLTDVAPFDNTMFIHLGDGLNEDAFQTKADDVARYLFTAATTGAQLDFRQWRSQSEDEPNQAAQLRMLGIDSQNARSLQVAASEAGNLTSLLLRRWAGAVVGGGTEKQMQLPAELTDTQTLLTELSLTDDTLPQQVVGLLRGETGQKIEAYASQVNERLAGSHDLSSITHSQVLDFLTQQLSQKDAADSQTLHGIVSEVQSKVSSVSRTCEAAIDTHLHQLLDSPHRMEGATAAARYMLATLQVTQQGCRNLLSRVETAFRDLAAQENSAAAFESEAAVQTFCHQYCVLLAYQTIHQCFVNHVSSGMNTVAAIATRFAELKHRVEDLAADVASPHLLTDSVPQPVVDAFDRYVRTSGPDCLAGFAKTDADSNKFSSMLIALATRFLMAAVDSTDGSGTETEACANQFPQSVWPFYRKAGGRRRVLGFVPEGMDADQWKQLLQKEFGSCVAVRVGDDESVSAVCEIEGVPIEAILNRLTVSNPHIADVAARIHTRVDIDW